MCGAFSIRLNPWERDLISKSGVSGVWKPIYNARPGEWLPIITEEEPNTITTAFWGYTPHWATKPQIKPVINARAESVADKPYFRSSFKSKRCLIPADGFYEWQTQGSKKVPYYFFQKDNKPFFFAGLYDEVPGQDGTLGFVIITTTPNTLVEKVHDRMPVMLDAGQENKWLNSTTKIIELVNFLDPYPEKLMSKYQVSQQVNSAKNKSADILDPVS